MTSEGIKALISVAESDPDILLLLLNAKPALATRFAKKKDVNVIISEEELTRMGKISATDIPTYKILCKQAKLIFKETNN